MGESNETTLMAERVGQLQEEIAGLNQRLKTEKKLREKAERRESLWFINDRWWFGITMFCLLCSLFMLPGYPIFMALTADTRPTHCEIKRNSSCSFDLYGRVPWRSDVSYGSFGSLDEAEDAARRLKCDVRSQR